MAFRYKKGLNHSPDWYESHYRGEPRGGPLIGCLKRDLKTLDWGYDERLEFKENIGRYREAFDVAKKGEVLDGRRFDQLASMCYDVIESEMMDGSGDEAAFTEEPYNTISELMLENGINGDTMRHFLKWRSRQKEVQEKEKALREQRARANQKATELLHRFRRKKPAKPKPKDPPQFFGYEGDEKLPVVEPDELP